jgi:uncharacterized protein
VLVRVYLADEAGRDDVVRLIADPSVAKVTGSWTRIEVSGALVRAARSGRGEETNLLRLLDADLAGPVVVVDAPQEAVEREALSLVRRYALRATDAWHLAVASIAVPPLLHPGEPRAFASRDRAQRAVAEDLGFLPI